MKGGNKYQPLRTYLSQGDCPHSITLTLTEIEAILNDKLPDSAWRDRAWWSNRSRGALQARAWMEAGYVADSTDLPNNRITFRQPPTTYKVEIVNGTVKWNAELVKGLRRHMGLTQMEFARELGVRQQTVSEWETGVYEPTLATSKHLTLVAEKASFAYGQPPA